MDVSQTNTCWAIYFLRYLWTQHSSTLDPFIDIESLQNRLLKVCYVPATSAILNRVLFFLFLLQLTKQTRQAAHTIKQSILLRCLWTHLWVIKNEVFWKCSQFLPILLVSLYCSAAILKSFFEFYKIFLKEWNSQVLRYIYTSDFSKRLRISFLYATSLPAIAISHFRVATTLSMTTFSINDAA